MTVSELKKILDELGPEFENALVLMDGKFGWDDIYIRTGYIWRGEKCEYFSLGDTDSANVIGQFVAIMAEPSYLE